MEAFERHEVLFVTYDSLRTKNLKYKKYLLQNIGTSFFKMFLAFFKFLKIFVEERPNLVISTGAEIAIPAFCIAKLLKIKTIFVESWCRIEKPSGTGRIVYYLSDVFLVQWPQLLSKYGKKAKYMGAVI